MTKSASGTAGIEDNRPTSIHQRQLLSAMDAHVTRNTTPLQRNSISYKKPKCDADGPLQCYRDEKFEDGEVIFNLITLNSVHSTKQKEEDRPYNAPHNILGEYQWNGSQVFNPRQQHAIERLDSNVLNKDRHHIWDMPFFSRRRFIGEAIEKVHEPHWMDQGRTGTCGVVSIQYLKALRDPVRFIDQMTELFFDGRLDGEAIEEKHGKHNNASGLYEFDWMFTVPFRDREYKKTDQGEEEIRSFQGEPGKGSATISEIKRWMKTELGAVDIQYRPFKNIQKGTANLKKKLKQGAGIILIVDGDILERLMGLISSDSSEGSHHSVVLNKIEEVDQNGTAMVELEVHTWQQLATITLEKDKLNELIEDYLVGSFPIKRKRRPYRLPTFPCGRPSRDQVPEL
ncbi:MAG: hypothetical protein AAGA66_11325 [Bacteroidota bacterium]